MIHRIRQITDRTLEWASLLCLSAMGTVVLIQVFARFLLPKTPAWTEEAARMFFIFTISFAGGLAVRDHALIGFDVLVERLPLKANRILRIVIHMIITVFMGILAWQSILFIRVGHLQTSPILEIRMSYVFSSMLVLFLFTGIYSALEAATLLRKIRQPVRT
jgi:TRAP-type C4-dicarboxylate transport system permease small subunit